MKIITTSWDDGHPLDFKLADLLDKYDLQATFYIPKTNSEHNVMSEQDVAALAKRFEIGGHTLDHVRLYSRLSQKDLDTQIVGCFNWLTEVTGNSPQSFCFPGGVVDQKAISTAKNIGFKVLRTTELLATNRIDANELSPTTLQIFNHSRLAYLKNTVKRSRYNLLLRWLAAGGETDLNRLLDYYLTEINDHGGCLHLWGHSWEIEEYGLWAKLESVFQQITKLQEFTYIENKDLNY